MAEQLRHVWHFGKRDMAFVALENMGTPLVSAICPFCKERRDHWSTIKDLRSYYICTECGEASILVTVAEEETL